MDRAHTVVVEGLNPQGVTRSAKGTVEVPGTNVKAEARYLLVSRASDDALSVSTEVMSEYGNGGWQLCLGLPCGGGLPTFGLSRDDDQGRNPAAVQGLVSVQPLTDSASGYRTLPSLVMAGKDKTQSP